MDIQENGIHLFMDATEQQMVGLILGPKFDSCQES